MSETVKPKAKAKEIFEVAVGDPPTATQFVVVRPSRKDVADARREHVRVLTALLREGALLAKEVDNVARQRNLWDDDREKRAREIGEEIRALLPVVKGQVEKTTKAAARAAAIRIRVLRMELMDIGEERRSLYRLTAEDKASDAEFHFLLVRCVRTNDNRPVWATVDQMVEDERDELRDKAVQALMRLYYGADSATVQRDLPENQFLLAHGYCDADLTLVDPATGRRVDVEGRPIDEKGRLVDADGHLVDERGVRINEDGTPAGPVYPFVD